jgi:hypothetical protein
MTQALYAHMNNKIKKKKNILLGPEYTPGWKGAGQASDKTKMGLTVELMVCLSL